MKFRSMRIWLFAALVLCVLAGCEQKTEPAPAANAEPFIGVLLYADDDVYISLVRQSIEGALEGKANYEVLAAGRDQFVQDGQVDDLIARKVSVLAVNMVDVQAASQVVDKARKAGVPLVFFNREPDLGSIKAYDKARFVGTIPIDAGRMQGDIIKRLWDAHPEYDRNGDGRFQYVMLQANADNPEALARTEYSVREARERGVAMQQVGDTLLCNWDEEQAYQAMRLALAAHGNEIELVIANNDSMALGAVRALAEQGYNREGGEPDTFRPVIGVDAIPEGVEAIRKGVMSATVKQDGVRMGETIAAFVLNAAAGKDFLDGVPLEWDESGIAVRIPYSPYAGE